MAAAHAAQRTIGLRLIGLQRPAQIEEGVFDRRGDAVGVVGIVGGQQVRHRLGQTGLGVQREPPAFQREEGAGAEQRRPLDIGIEHLAEGLDLRRQALGAEQIGLIAVGRGDQRRVRRQVDGAGVAGQAVDRGAGGQHHALGAMALGVEEGHGLAVYQEARPLGRPAVPAAAGQVGVDARLGQIALILIQPVAGVGLQRQQDVVAVRLQIAVAGDQFGGRSLQPALTGDAVAGAELQTLEILAGDDVGDARHRVRAVDGRGAVLQHLQPLGRDHRQGVQIDEGVRQAAAGEAVVGHAPPVQQHQGVLLRQAAQADARRARRPAAVLRLVRAVAGVGRDRTQQVRRGRLARAFQLFASDHLNRVEAFGVGAADVGACHDDIRDGVGRRRCGLIC